MKQLKISRLFHWLYAILMLLPVFSVLFTCLYVCFNKNAKESYYGDTINEVETIEVASSDLQVNVTYFLQTDTEYHSLERVFIYTDYVKILNNNTEYTNLTSIQISSSETSTYIAFYNGSTYLDALTPSAVTTIYLIEFNYLSEQNISDIPYTLLTNEYNKYSFLDNVFYYSLDQVANSDMFGWANNSFICEPFKFITGLFGVQSDNAINTYLSYWGSISIIWLVFDLVLYVPLLAHKWLDDGSI